MSNVRRIRFLALLFALSISLLGASTSLAKSSHQGNARQRHIGPAWHVRERLGGVTDLSEARALGAGRCPAGSFRRRVGGPGRRGRCVKAASERPAKGSAVAQPIYWGATIGAQLTGEEAPWDMSAVSRLEEEAHKSLSLVQFFQPFANCGSSGCSLYPFPTTPLNEIRAHGSIPVLSWSSQSIPSTMSEPDFQLSDVIEGRYDEYIREFATKAKEWGHPFFLRFDWEMNGDWFPWAEGVNGNLPGEYVAAWRHVHDIFTSVGAGNVSWVWCPFVDPAGNLGDLTSLYPGDEYVDWTALDGYNWGTNPAGPKGWRSFNQLFERSYGEITQSLAPSKPMMIAEVGSSEQGGSKSEWVRDALSTIPTDYPKVRALLWFDKFDSGMDWPIETSSSAAVAFAEGIGSSAYAGASYGDLEGGAIQPPS